ncbi:MAG: T9SS type A sorting domain-containing protein, partial [Bacteroidia bacterium]|nr:T9SS type A sorting domain-containing protein [Bacteroidia bacterium]
QYGVSDHPLDPLINADCITLKLMPDNLLHPLPYIDWGSRPWWLPSEISWPPPQPPQPYLPNYISRHNYFPHKDNGMSVIIDNFVHPNYKNDIFSGFSQSELDMQVDWVKVSQPFCCGVDKSVCDLSDLDAQTHFTDILTGRKLTIANTSGSCSFVQNTPRPDNWRDIPVVLLATDEIAINSEAIFPSGTYTEMQIVTCGSSTRISTDEEAQLNDYKETQNALMDSIADADQPIYDSIANAYVQNYIDSINREYSQYEPGHRKHMGQEETSVINIGYADDDISISPNPSADVIDIKSSNWLFDKIKLIYVLDVNGREIELKKARTININELAKGSYILKIVMDDGTLLKKKLIKL